MNILESATIATMNCEICDTIKYAPSEKLIIIKNSRWQVVLDPNQQNLGKCWVTLLSHKKNLSELDDFDWSEFTAVVRELELNCLLVFSPHHFNWQCLMNDADSKKQETHVHWHFASRYNNPVNFNNEIFIDENYPRTNRTVRPTNQETLIKIAENIKDPN